MARTNSGGSRFQATRLEQPAVSKSLSQAGWGFCPATSLCHQALPPEGRKHGQKPVPPNLNSPKTSAWKRTGITSSATMVVGFGAIQWSSSPAGRKLIKVVRRAGRTVPNNRDRGAQVGEIKNDRLLLRLPFRERCTAVLSFRRALSIRDSSEASSETPVENSHRQTERHR